MTGVEDERLPARQTEAERGREAGAPLLDQARGQAHGVGFFRIVIDVEIRGGQHLETQALVLHFVLAEILARGAHGQRGEQADEQRDAMSHDDAR